MVKISTLSKCNKQQLSNQENRFFSKLRLTTNFNTMPRTHTVGICSGISCGGACVLMLHVSLYHVDNNNLIWFIAVIIEAQKCLCNIVFNSPKAQRTCVYVSVFSH